MIFAENILLLTQLNSTPLKKLLICDGYKMSETTKLSHVIKTTVVQETFIRKPILSRTSDMEEFYSD